MLANPEVFRYDPFLFIFFILFLVVLGVVGSDVTFVKKKK